MTLLNPQFGFHLLGQFMEPITASEAARRMGQSASKVSYHVGKLQELGLLQVTPAPTGRGQQLQAVAQRFVLHPALFPVLSLSNETLRPMPMLSALFDAFLSSSDTPEPDATKEYVLMDFRTGADTPHMPHGWEDGQRGLVVQQFHLTRERYLALLNDLQDRVVQEAQASRDTPAGRWHTLALLAFPGVLLPMAEETPPRP